MGLSSDCSPKIDPPLGVGDLYSPDRGAGWEVGRVVGEFTAVARPSRRRDHLILKGAVSVGSRFILG